MTPTNFAIAALLAGLPAGRVTAQTVDWRPSVEVVLDNRAPSAAPELAAARTRVGFIFGEAGVRVMWVSRGGAALGSGQDRIYLVVLDQPEADRIIAGDARRLGFAIPPANRVYVHYERVYALARYHGVQPGWFLGVVMSHELAHVLLPAGHSDAGVMMRALSPDPGQAPAFTPLEAQVLRSRLGGETTLARR